VGWLQKGNETAHDHPEVRTMLLLLLFPLLLLLLRACHSSSMLSGCRSC